MDGLTLRRHLNALWPLVHTATWRQLSTSEARQLRRVSELLESDDFGSECLTQRKEAVCLWLYSCGLFEDDRSPAGLDDLLMEIDQLRNSVLVLGPN